MNGNMYKDYCKLIEDKKILDTKISEAQEQLYTAHIDRLNEKDSGTIKINDCGYLLTVIKRESVKVDQKLAESVGIGFKIKYELDKRKYNMLDANNKSAVDKCLTHTPARPSFKVEIGE